MTVGALIAAALVLWNGILAEVPRTCTGDEVNSGRLRCKADTLSFLAKCAGPCGSGGTLDGWYETCTDAESGGKCTKFVQCTPDCHNGSYSDSLKACFCSPGYRGECCEEEMSCSSARPLTNSGGRSVLSSSEDGTYRYCDWFLPVDWYRFNSPAGDRLPEHPVAPGRCNTLIPLYLNGAHPSENDGTVVRQVCGSGEHGPCQYKFDIQVRNCGDFMSYRLQPAYICPMAYCLTNGTHPDVSTSTAAPSSSSKASSKPVTDEPSTEADVTTEPVTSEEPISESTTDEPETTTTTDTSDSTSTPVDFDCPVANGLFSHPTDPHKFIECSNWIPYVFTCPSGLVFDDRTKRCEWPQTSVSPDASQPTEEPQTTTTTTSPPPSPTTSAAPSSSSQATKESDATSEATQGSTSSLDFQCPASDGLYKYPTDPHKFIQCSNGIPYVFDCPGGLVFSETTLRCEWPSSAEPSGEPTVEPATSPKADTSSSAASTQVTSTTTKAAPITASTAHPTEGPTQGSSTKGTRAKPQKTAEAESKPSSPVIKCPKSGGLFKHPTDPQKFVHCSNSIPFVKDCPGKLVFDDKLKICNYA